MRRGLDPYVPAVVEPPSSGPPGDLVELPHGQDPGVGSVVLTQLGKQHGADWHVYPNTEGVGPTDHLQEAPLGELFDQASVAGEHPGVVEADAVTNEPAEVLADRGVEPEALQIVTQGALLGLGQHVEAAQVLGLVGGRLLGEVHYVHRGPILLDQVGDRLVQRGLPVGELEGNRPFGVRHHPHPPTGTGFEVFGEALGRSEGGRHE